MKKFANITECCVFDCLRNLVVVKMLLEILSKLRNAFKNVTITGSQTWSATC